MGKTPVRSVFKGEVAKVFLIKGANMTVIIRHGKYLTVYENIVDLKVKPGDKVDTKQEIGNVYCDSEGNKAILKFMIFEEKENLDPESGLQKNNGIYETNMGIFKYNVWQFNKLCIKRSE